MIKKTGGVLFDKDERNVYFLASNIERMIHGKQNHKHLLVALNEINTDNDIDTVRGWIKEGKKVFIDSGVFWLAMEHARAHNITMDEALNTPPEKMDNFDILLDKYLNLMPDLGESAWGYIELDMGGRDNKIKTREFLESKGLRPIPVYHPFNDGWDYFDYLAERYDRICFGNVVQATSYVRKRLIATAWERHKKHPDLWIHLLGFTPNQWLNAYLIDSGDSSAWLSVVRWSGYKERTMLKAFSDMERNFQYSLGECDTNQGSIKATKMSSYGSYINELNWQNHIKSLSDLGINVYE